MSAVLAERIAKEQAAAGEALATAASSAERRRNAVTILAAGGLPTTRDENWKYANLRAVERARLAPSVPRTRSDVSAEMLPAPFERYARYAFVDGVFAPHLSRAGEHPGVTVQSMRKTDPLEPMAGPPPSPDERFALLNDAFATDGALVRVARGANCTACVEVLFIATEPASAAASYPRLELRAGAESRVGLIERHISVQDDANFVNGVVHVEAGANAQVTHYRVQEAGARATWIDTLSAVLERDARYTLHLVSLGGLSARSTVHVRLLGERAELGLHAVSLGDRQQVHDAFALVEHLAAHTRSEQSVRGIASGRARIAFNSKVVVREGAHGTDSRQSLRGLLAGAEAEIDVRPQLEIYTDDVKCSHGATAGKLDDNMLFYLLSRGIEPDTAQQLLKWAFLEDVVARIDVPQLRRHIEQSLAGQMKETAALKELL
jgi:Fe-S cluster assembly protein SufD